MFICIPLINSTKNTHKNHTAENTVHCFRVCPFLRMKKKNQEAQKEKERIESVLQLLRRQAPLTVKQEKYCNNPCVERFLKAKGNNVKKAAKQLRNCLSWRDSIGTDNLRSDEFPTELAEGSAYVAGNDNESRPVMIFRIKQDYLKFHSQKLFSRLLVFTMEVAIQNMAINVEQFVLLFDASLFKSASAFMNMLLATLKITGDYYPGRLHKAFVIDPPSLFPFMWKGIRTFVELSSLITVVSSLDFEQLFEFNGYLASYPRTTSLRFDQSSTPTLDLCSSRFSFSTSSSHNLDSIKPWYLSMGPAISPLNARSFSFTSPTTRAPRDSINTARMNFFPSTPMPQKTQKLDPSTIRRPTTPKPSFLHSPSLIFRKDSQSNRAEKSKDSFVSFLKFYRRPYDEKMYRSKMRPPLLVVSPHLNQRHMSVSHRF